MHWIIVSAATLSSPYSFKHQQKRFLKLGPYLFSSLGGSLDEPAKMVAIWLVGVERAHGVEKVEVGQSHLSTPRSWSQSLEGRDDVNLKRRTGSVVSGRRGRDRGLPKKSRRLGFSTRSSQARLWSRKGSLTFMTVVEAADADPAVGSTRLAAVELDRTRAKGGGLLSAQQTLAAAHPNGERTSCLT